VDTVNHLIKNNTWAVILLAITTSLVLPSLGWQLKPYLNYLLATMMFLSCLDLKIKEIIQSISDPKPLALTIFIIHLVSPLIIFFFRDLFSPEIYLGLILAASIPAGRSSVFLSLIYGGVPIRALITSTASNLLSPILVPAIVYLFAHQVISLPLASMSKTIVAMVLIPLITGYLFGKTRPGQKLSTFTPSLSTLILFLIILGILSPIKETISQNLPLTLVLTVFVSILIIINFYLGSSLKPSFPEKITYGLTSSYKNYTMGTLLSLTLFPPLVALPSIAYTISNNLLLTPLQFLHRWPRLTPHHQHKYKNLIILILSLGFTFALTQSSIISNLTHHLKQFGYLSVFIAGSLFASTFTVAIGALIIANIASLYNPLIIVIIGALGAVATDFLIFKLVRHKAETHVNPIYKLFPHHQHLQKILHTKFFGWSLSLVGAIILASPLPDELGISLMGLSTIKNRQFFLISYLSHTFGLATLLASLSLFT
jgi:BASS family bile acid:Na+ symporter